MTLQVSTAFKASILGASSFASIFNNGRILVYSGIQPLTADMPIQGTLLAEISHNATPWDVGGAGGGGLLFQLSGAYVLPATGQNWRARVVANGTAGWFRLTGPDLDGDGLSYSFPRIDGSIGLAGSSNELILDTTTMTAGENIPVQNFLYTIPPLV